jgi:hypothetical protein
MFDQSYPFLSYPTPAGQKIFTEAMMPDVVEMVKVSSLSFPSLLTCFALFAFTCSVPFCFVLFLHVFDAKCISPCGVEHCKMTSDEGLR